MGSRNGAIAYALAVMIPPKLNTFGDEGSFINPVISGGGGGECM